MRQLMRFLQKLPEEGPLSLMVDGKIIPCKSISITEDLVMVTASDDAVWYLDPDRIAGFSSDFIGESLVLEEEILPSMHPHEGEGRGQAGTPPLMPHYEGPTLLGEELEKYYNQRTQGVGEMVSLLQEMEKLEEKDEQQRAKDGEVLLAQIGLYGTQFPECAQGLAALQAGLYGLLGEARKAGALFLKNKQAREAVALLYHQDAFKDETENRLLLGYALLYDGEQEDEEWEEIFGQYYAALCTEAAQMDLFRLLYERNGQLGKAGEEALVSFLERRHPEKRLIWETDQELLECMENLEPSREGLFQEEECLEAAKALMAEAVIGEDALSAPQDTNLPPMVFYVSSVKSRSYAGYQQAHLFFRKDAPLEGEERHYQEVYLNPRQVLDPLLGELLQKGTEMDLAGLHIAFTPILNDKGVAGGDAFLVKEDRKKVYAQASKEVLRWCRHETFIRYGARPYMGAAEMEEAFTTAACEAHQVEAQDYISDWQVLRFLRMALCEDVEGAALPAAYTNHPKAKRCALSLIAADTKEEKNLWISRLYYWLLEEGEEESAALLEYFLFGLPSNNAFHLERETPGKTSKEALWVKMQTLCASLRLFQIPAVAGQWRNAMLRDRRVKDMSMLGGSHRKAWEKVTLLEGVAQALIKEERAEGLVLSLEDYLSDTEKEKCRSFLSLAQKEG